MAVLLATEHNGRTEGFWPKVVVAVRTKHSKLCTKRALEGQYPIVCLKQAKFNLVST